MCWNPGKFWILQKQKVFVGRWPTNQFYCVLSVNCLFGQAEHDFFFPQISSNWSQIAFGGYVHQEMHQHIIQFYLSDCLKEFLFAVFGGSLIGEELLRDVGKKDDWMVVEAFMLASEIDAVY